MVIFFNQGVKCLGTNSIEFAFITEMEFAPKAILYLAAYDCIKIWHSKTSLQIQIDGHSIYAIKWFTPGAFFPQAFSRCADFVVSVFVEW